MISISIRDKETAIKQSSPYPVLIAMNGTSQMAYKTITEFMEQWYDTLCEAKVNVRSFSGQETVNLMFDWTINDCYEYSNGLQACIDNGARECRLLSNGTVRRGAILVDKNNRTTTFFRLNPNDKEAK